MYYNYLFVRSDLKHKKQFLVIDTQECLVDYVFASHRLNVDVGKEYAKPGRTYCFVECTVRSRDVDEFRKAMEDLKAEMEKFGHHDYEAFCSEAEDQIEAYSNGAFLMA